eukprot:g42120.t1
MVPDNLLDVHADGTVAKDKGNPIAVAGGKRPWEGRSAGVWEMGWTLPTTVLENPHLRKKVDIFGGSLVKVGLIGTYAEMEDWNGIFIENRVQGQVQVAVGVGGFIVSISGQSILRNGNRDVKEGKGGVRVDQVKVRSKIHSTVLKGARDLLSRILDNIYLQATLVKHRDNK